MIIFIYLTTLPRTKCLFKDMNWYTCIIKFIFINKQIKRRLPQPVPIVSMVGRPTQWFHLLKSSKRVYLFTGATTRYDETETSREFSYSLCWSTIPPLSRKTVSNSQVHTVALVRFSNDMYRTRSGTFYVASRNRDQWPLTLSLDRRCPKFCSDSHTIDKHCFYTPRPFLQWAWFFLFAIHLPIRNTGNLFIDVAYD